jgi:NAD dependent epimerase/dehydratase family enzyme
MSKLVIEGQRAIPRRALELGYEHRHPDLDEALRSALRDT